MITVKLVEESSFLVTNKIAKKLGLKEGDTVDEKNCYAGMC